MCTGKDATFSARCCGTACHSGPCIPAFIAHFHHRPQQQTDDDSRTCRVGPPCGASSARSFACRAAIAYDGDMGRFAPAAAHHAARVHWGSRRGGYVVVGGMGKGTCTAEGGACMWATQSFMWVMPAQIGKLHKSGLSLAAPHTAAATPTTLHVHCTVPVLKHGNRRP